MFWTKNILPSQINQWTVYNYLKANVDEQAEILTDNWRMSLQAWKNRYAFSEESKRWERYLIYKYKKGN